MKLKRFLIGMITIGVVIGWVMGYYAGRVPDLSVWWSILLLLCIILASAFILKLADMRQAKPSNPNPKKKK